MFRFEGCVQYADGNVVEFEAGNVGLSAWERYAIRHKLPMGEGAPPTISSLVVAHHALGIEEALDPWIETVEGIELKAKGQELTAKELRKVLGLAEDSTDAEARAAVEETLVRVEAEAPAVPPTRPEPSTV